jgi:hypothetical protein
MMAEGGVVVVVHGDWCWHSKSTHVTQLFTYQTQARGKFESTMWYYDDQDPVMPQLTRVASLVIVHSLTVQTIGIGLQSTS